LANRFKEIIPYKKANGTFLPEKILPMLVSIHELPAITAVNFPFCFA